MSKTDLLKGLNEDLAAEWGTIIRYTLQASMCYGPLAIELRQLLHKEVEDEILHARYLSDVIMDLGGRPTSQAKDFPRPEELRDMLELNIKMEKQDVENYVKHANLAAQLHEIELKFRLEQMAADEAAHARELRRLYIGLDS